jgi:hypothetical protein
MMHKGAEVGVRAPRDWRGRAGSMWRARLIKNQLTQRDGKKSKQTSNFKCEYWASNLLAQFSRQIFVQILGMDSTKALKLPPL